MQNIKGEKLMGAVRRQCPKDIPDVGKSLGKTKPHCIGFTQQIKHGSNIDVGQTSEFHEGHVRVKLLLHVFYVGTRLLPGGLQDSLHRESLGLKLSERVEADMPGEAPI